MRRFLIPVFLFLGLVAVAATARLLPHPPNFAPVAAVAVFGGFFFRRTWIPITAVVLSMLASDLILGFYSFWIMAFVYAGLAFPAVFGPLLKRKLTPLRLVSCTLLGSLAFFTTSNFAVWAFASYYESSFTGLVQCYVAGIPFFKWTLAGDLTWTAIFFSLHWVVCRSPSPAPATTSKPAAINVS